MKLFIAAGLLASSMTWSQWHQAGFMGQGGKEFSHKFGTYLYGRIGNQNDDANPRVIQSLLPANDPSYGEKVIYRVGCLNIRKDGYGQKIDDLAASLQKFGENRAKCYLNPFCFYKPTYTWFRPNSTQIYNIEAGQITEAIRRWKSKGLRDEDILIEVGNEPNYYVSMTPGEYAYLYKNYYSLIKSVNPNIKVAIGALFAFEMIPQDSRDLIADMMLKRGMQQTAEALGPVNAFSTHPLVFLASLGTSALIAWGFDAWGGYAGERATRDVKNLIYTRMFSYTSVSYMKAVMDQLPQDIVPDIVSVHFYPGDFKALGDPWLLADQAVGIARDVQGTVFSARYYQYPIHPFCSADYCPGRIGPEIWVTEFGNVNPYLDEQEIANRIYTFSLSFQDAGFAGWLWYKPIGKDAQMDLAKDLGIQMPVTRLVTTETYGSPEEDPLPILPNLVPCDRLNRSGLYYYYVSNDWNWCQD